MPVIGCLKFATLNTRTFMSLKEHFSQIAWLKLPVYHLWGLLCNPNIDRQTFSEATLNLCWRPSRPIILKKFPSCTPQTTNPCHQADPLKHFGGPVWPAASLALIKDTSSLLSAWSCFSPLLCCCSFLLTNWGAFSLLPTSPSNQIISFS